MTGPMNQVRYFCDVEVTGEGEEDPLLGRGEGRVLFLCQDYGSIPDDQKEEVERIGGLGATRAWLSSHKKLLVVVILLLWLLIGLVLLLNVFIVAPVIPPPMQDKQLRVLSLSVWGAPHSLGTRDKEERIEAIAAYLSNQTDYDLIALQDLWMRPDHETIRSKLSKAFTMTTVGSLAPALCDGRVLPTACSGLAVLSRFPIIESGFTAFSVHGDLLWFDGEYWARKGTARVRIRPAWNHTVDIFVTATAAYDYNYYYRQIQAEEFSAVVSSSDADYVLAAASLNSDPRNSESTFHRFCTYGNRRNSYSSVDTPMVYDYWWYRQARGRSIKVQSFSVPLLKTAEGLSFSNHEAVAATFLLNTNH